MRTDHYRYFESVSANPGLAVVCVFTVARPQSEAEPFPTFAPSRGGAGSDAAFPTFRGSAAGSDATFPTFVPARSSSDASFPACGVADGADIGQILGGWDRSRALLGVFWFAANDTFI